MRSLNRNGRILMTCKELEGLATEYLEEALPSSRRLDFEAHLKTCPACQKYLGEMRALIEASHRLGGRLNDSWQARAAQTQEGFFDTVQVRALDRPRGLRMLHPKLAPVALLVVAFAVLGGLWLYHRPPQIITKDLTIDLSHWETLRGEEQPVHQPVQLERARLNLTILLPLGEEPGDYEVAVQRDGTTLVDAKTEGKFENHITTLHLFLDCSHLKSGPYDLTVRKAHWSRQEFPAVVH